MSTTAIQPGTLETPWSLPYKGHVGMLCLIAAESSIFMIFVVAYVFYIGKSLSGPTPREILEIPVFATVCLLSSSITIHFAVNALRKANLTTFRFLWFATFALGAIFIVATGHEWHRFIYEKDFTVSTNLFGTTYYSLVGLHAFHVCVGLVGLLTILLLSLPGRVRPKHSPNVDTFAMYWHFVDAVWVVVFTIVYIVGR